MKRIIFYITGLFLLSACSSNKALVREVPDKAELRGVWIASVENIDWPRGQNLSVETLKGDYAEILDFYEKHHFNAVYVQIRTAGDALYPSSYAPWSRYITGKEGHPLSEDILPWLIKETHKRGMEFHAWLNPYRATTSLDTSILSEMHAYYQHPDWMILYGNKYYFNPGLLDVQDHLLDVISEVVEKYPVDGVHFDDYFYPYKIKNLSFDDSLSYSMRLNRELPLDDWRRDNVNRFIQSCYENIHAINPHIKFGVSPFGVWRNIADDPTGSDSRAGQTVYDDLYADTRAWIKEGWLDYIAPQLYWSMEYPAASHRKLVNWWSVESSELPLYVGVGIYKVQNNHDSAWNDLLEIPTQIQYGRETKVVDGFISFSAKSLMNQNELAQIMSNGVLQEKSLTPAQYKWTMTDPNFKWDIDYVKKDKVILLSDIDHRADHIVVDYLRPKGFLKREKWKQRQVEIIDRMARWTHKKNEEKITARFISRAGVPSRAMDIRSELIQSE